jgi:hypothetical protein
VQWYELASRLNLLRLGEEKDEPVWRWTSNRRFSVKSIYEHLTSDDRGSAYKRIWKSKIPEKIKIFMWLLEQRVVLTKDNMLKRNWYGNPDCYFCGAPESNDHLFFACPIAKVIWGVVACCFKQKTRPVTYDHYWVWIKSALLGGEHVYMLGVAAICWAIWKARNKTCFEKKHIKNPIEIIYSACSFMHYWTGLYQEDTQQAISEGIELMLRAAVKLLGRQTKRLRLMLQSSQDTDVQSDEENQADGTGGAQGGI